MAAQIYLNFPTKTSNDATWIAWYDSLPTVLKKSERSAVFLEVWKRNGSSDANTAALREYLHKKGIDIAANTLTGSLIDSSNHIIDGLGDLFRFGAGASMLLAGGIIVFTGLIIWRLAKPEAVGTIIKTAAI